MKAAVASVIAALLFGAALGVFGCGEKAEPDLGEREAEEGGEAGLSEEERESRERASAARRIPAQDRATYYQVATSSGLIRSRAVAVLRRDPVPPRAGPDELEAALERTEGLQPRDRGLVRLLELIRPALKRALDDPLTPSDARALIAVSGRLNVGLRRYLRREPATAVLVPD